MTHNDIFQHLFSVVSSERFLKKQGLGNEVPFFICPYTPERAVEMGRLQEQLIKRLAESGKQVLSINLYDLTLDLLEQEGDLEWLLENETSLTKEKLLEELQGILDVETVLIPAIAQTLQAEPYDVLLLTGIGEVFPYIRSHNVLNNLQSTAKEKPTLMFFPGDYIHSLETGASLELFGRLRDDKYYRAFNIFHYEA
ncbi:MAG: DUF1788 domain-containing protein [Thiotrichales bacterium]|nr:DUF1788 domain-containing protein [Thiotrichales bacterium]